jgi:CRP/FNR family transcriptional regulator
MQTLQGLFPQLEPELLQQMETESLVKQFAVDDIIMRSGQYIKSTIIILDGLVKIYRENEDGGEFLMYFLQPGEACAVSMLCVAKMEASQVMAKAVEPATVLLVPLHLMDEWMMRFKSWNNYVISTYRNRFDELLLLIDQVAFRNMDERLLFYLQRHSEANNSSTIQLSHQQIADDLNSSREVVSRLLKKMEQRKLVLLHRNAIELLEGQ